MKLHYASKRKFELHYFLISWQWSRKNYKNTFILKLHKTQDEDLPLCPWLIFTTDRGDSAHLPITRMRNCDLYRKSIVGLSSLAVEESKNAHFLSNLMNHFL